MSAHDTATRSEPARRSDAARDWEHLTAPQTTLEYFNAWLALQCRALGQVSAALLVVEEANGAFVPAAIWPSPTQDVTHLGPSAQQCLTQRRGEVLRDETRQASYLTYPFEVEHRLYGAVVVELAMLDDNALSGAARQLHWGAASIEQFFTRQTLAAQSAQLSRGQVALDVVALAGEHPKLADAALAVANELATRLSCRRVSIGLLRKQLTRLLAISNTAFFDRKSRYVADIENAMDEAIDQRKTICYPPSGDTSSGIAIANRDLAGTGSVCTVIIRTGGQSYGAISFERATNTGFSAEEIILIQAVASLLCPMLEMKELETHWLAGRSAHAMRWMGESLRDPRRPGFRLALVAVLGTVAALSVWPGQYRVGAKAVLEGEVQRAVSAPFDGFIASAPVRAGQIVKKGQVLATLDDRDLRLERAQWTSAFDQHDRKYRDALSKRDRAQARILAAQVAEAQAQLSLVEDKLARTNLLAPFDGAVVTGDLSQLLGSPVEQGKLLFEVAPLDAYRVVLKVDERDIRQVTTGQPGNLVLSGLAGKAWPLTIINIATSEPADGQNFFRVEAKLHDAPPQLRPGMEGVGKIEIGERRLIWIWTHRLWEWLQLLWWKWMP